MGSRDDFAAPPTATSAPSPSQHRIWFQSAMSSAQIKVLPQISDFFFFLSNDSVVLHYGSRPPASPFSAKKKRYIFIFLKGK